MQPLYWYAQRLRAMTPGEVFWRARRTARDMADRCLIERRRRKAAREVAADGHALDAPGYSVCDVPAGVWSGERSGSTERAWAERLRGRADRIAAGLIPLFDLGEHALGEPVDWNRDAKTGKTAGLRFAPWIDYRDARVTGDCKFVWEPNRHQHFVVLARACRATGEACYAQAALTQWEHWLEQCPYGLGMNWRSPLELAIRLINWVWTLNLIRPLQMLTASFRAQLLNAVYLQLWEISRKYSRGSSANNHLIGEAAGVYIASRYFDSFNGAARLQAESSEILCDQIIAQTFSDGGSREQAFGYHPFVLQFLLLAGLVARHTGEDFPPAYWNRLHQMFLFMCTMAAGDDRLPMIGDCDDGYVLDLDADPHDIRPWLATGGSLFDDPQLRACAGTVFEASHWLPGALSSAALEPQAGPSEGQQLETCAFPESGYYLLQSGHYGQPDRISVVFDCGPLGYKTIAAHGHADALSFTLRAFGLDVLVDPGTFDYFSYPHWRSYFRSTRAHNTVVVDDVDQSVMRGPFLWGAQAQARCLEWEPGADGGRVYGEHDGYGRLGSPVIHRRSIELRGSRRELIIEDELRTDGHHDYRFYLHLAEHCQIARVDGNRYEIDVGPGSVVLELDRRLRVQVLRGSESPVGGWVSRGYHRKVASDTIIGRWAQRGRLHLRTRVEIAPAPLAAPVTPKAMRRTRATSNQEFRCTPQGG
jgi:hypothetical protein